MKKLWDKYRDKIIPFLLCALLLIGVGSGIALLGGAVMKIFGFEYSSVGSIIVFFIIAAIVSYPLSLLAGTLPKVLLSFGRLSKGTAILLYIVLDTAATYWGLKIVDYFMKAVHATDLSIIVVSFLLSLFGAHDIDKKPKGLE